MVNATKPSGISAVDEIRQLSKLVNDMEGAFREHQKIIKQRAMSLPQGVLLGLQQLHTDLDEVAKHIHDTQTAIQRLRALGDTTELINSTLDLTDVLNTVMDTVIKLTGAERGYLVLRNPDTNEMEFRVARNIDQRSLGEGEF